jgi:hypothetical protein
MRRDNDRATFVVKRSAGAQIAITALDIVGKIWTSLNTTVGLAIGGVGTLAGLLAGTHPRVKFGHNAIQFLNNPLINRGEALTLGNAISYNPGVQPNSPGAYGDREIQVGPHEEGHTYQAQVLGPFYGPAWLLCGGRVGLSNPFEAAAQRYGAGRGSWWPW